MYPLHMVMQIIASLAINFEIVGITTVYEALSHSLSLYDIVLTCITGLTLSDVVLKIFTFLLHVEFRIKKNGCGKPAIIIIKHYYIYYYVSYKLNFVRAFS